jgi:hypothetical protein
VCGGAAVFGQPVRASLRGGQLRWWPSRRLEYAQNERHAAGIAPGSVVAELLRVTWRSMTGIVTWVVAEASGRVLRRVRPGREGAKPLVELAYLTEDRQ